jgi:hypothetical protein
LNERERRYGRKEVCDKKIERMKRLILFHQRISQSNNRDCLEVCQRGDAKSRQVERQMKERREDIVGTLKSVKNNLSDKCIEMDESNIINRQAP